MRKGLHHQFLFRPQNKSFLSAEIFFVVKQFSLPNKLCCNFFQLASIEQIWEVFAKLYSKYYFQGLVIFGFSIHLQFSSQMTQSWELFVAAAEFEFVLFKVDIFTLGKPLTCVTYYSSYHSFLVSLITLELPMASFISELICSSRFSLSWVS